MYVTLLRMAPALLMVIVGCGMTNRVDSFSVTNMPYFRACRSKNKYPWKHDSRHGSLSYVDSGFSLCSSTNGSDNDDKEFYRDLYKAKMEKLGGEIPPEQAKQSAEQAENEFLNAMKETTEEFQQAKEQLGSQGAVDLFLGKIRKDDEQRYRQDGGPDGDNRDRVEDGAEEPFQ